MDTRGNTWAVVLAGGSGNRLAALTTGSDGVTVPKQFCRFGSPVTMLERTLERARAIVPPRRILPAVIDDHRRWWQTQLHGVPAENILVQPRNRGTGPALLHALSTVVDRNPLATLLVLPSDHGIEDEHVLRRAMFTLVSEARSSPEHVVLLGAQPDSAETSYGWIVRGAENPGPTAAVARFVEKPAASEAEALLRSGALWNTFMFACTAHALALLYATSRPLVMPRILGGASDDNVLAVRLAEDLPESDFSRDVLAGNTARLRVLSLPPCGWTDLGTPQRMGAWMNRTDRARIHSPARILTTKRPCAQPVTS